MAKQITLFDQAKRLQASLASIDRREEAAQIKLTSRFIDERSAVMTGASEAVLRIIEAARDATGAESG